LRRLRRSLVAYPKSEIQKRTNERTQGSAGAGIVVVVAAVVKGGRHYLVRHFFFWIEVRVCKGRERKGGGFLSWNLQSFGLKKLPKRTEDGCRRKWLKKQGVVGVAVVAVVAVAVAVAVALILGGEEGGGVKGKDEKKNGGKSPILSHEVFSLFSSFSLLPLFLDFPKSVGLCWQRLHLYCIRRFSHSEDLKWRQGKMEGQRSNFARWELSTRH